VKYLKLFLLSFRIALDGIATHKMRSFLTGLGIIFGVAAVVSMLAIGEGAQEEILNRIAVMGIDNVYVYDRGIVRQETLKSAGEFPSTGLSTADIDSIRYIWGNALGAAAPVIDVSAPVFFNGYTGEHTVVGTTDAYFRALKLPLQLGRYIMESDVTGRERVCVAGGGLYNRLRREGTVLSARIKIRDEWFTVVGILQMKGTAVKKDDNLDFEDFNFNLYVPFGSAVLSKGRDAYKAAVDRVILNAADKSYVSRFAGGVERMLLRRHNGLRDFKIVIPEELLRQHQETQRIFDAVLGAIAGISLLVGGIGIMNIMLASILERTREIGLRRALGATKMHIMLQFLLEAVCITVIGGAIGIIFALLLSRIVSIRWDMPVKVTFWACALSFSVAAATGIIFGFFPARKAGGMNPIDSLRYE